MRALSTGVRLYENWAERAEFPPAAVSSTGRVIHEAETTIDDLPRLFSLSRAVGSLTRISRRRP